MSKRALQKCPYCGEGLGYFTLLVHNRDGEYTCKRCNYNSNIKYKKSIFLMAIVSIIMSVIILLIYSSANVYEFKPVILIILLIPFLIFYICVPFFIEITKR